MTALGTVTPRALTLYMERINVVLAKEKRPLEGNRPIRHGGAPRTKAHNLQRTGVANDPQLRGGVVNIGAGRECTCGVSVTAVVVLVTDVVRVADGGLLGGGGHCNCKDE